MNISKYKYIADLTGYYIFYDEVLIAGLSLNVSIMPRPINGLYLEYHRQEAKKLLKQIIDEENRIRRIYEESK